MRARLVLPVLGFLVCAAAFTSYPTYFVRFPVTRDVPWANWLLFVLGLALVAAGMRRAYAEPGRSLAKVTGPIFATLSLATLGFFLFVTEVASRWLPASPDAPRVGQTAPDFALPAADGSVVRLAERLDAGRWALLIFYRGSW